MASYKISDRDLKGSIVEKLQAVNIKTFTDLTQIGLTAGTETIDDIMEALPENSILQLGITDKHNTAIYPYATGNLIIEDIYNTSATLRFYARISSKVVRVWKGVYTNDEFSGWTRVFSETDPPTVADINNAASVDYVDNQIASVMSTGIPKLQVYALPLIEGTEGQTEFIIDLATFDINTDTVLVQKGMLLLNPDGDYTVVDNKVVLGEGTAAGQTIGIWVFKNVPAGEEGTVSGVVIRPGTITADKLADDVKDSLGGGKLQTFTYPIEATAEGQTEFEIPLATFDEANDTVFVIDGQGMLMPGVGFKVSGRTITMTEGWGLGDGGGIIVLRNATVNPEDELISGVKIADGTITANKLADDVFTDINNEIAAVKKSVSDGKTAVANAITAKGISTATDAEFATMATNISSIITLENGTGDATAVAGDMLSGKTAYVKGSKVTGSMVNNGAVSQTLDANGTYTIPAGYHNGQGKVTQSLTGKAAATITPGTADQTIAANQWLTGIQTIKGDANLIAANIKSGVSIFGVAGNSNVVDTSAGDATAAQILSGKKAYVDGALVTGTIASQAAQTITPGTSDKTIASGKYLSGVQTIKGDANLVAGNIAKGKTIFGVSGTYDPGLGISSSTYSNSRYIAYSESTVTVSYKPKLVIVGMVQSNNKPFAIFDVGSLYYTTIEGGTGNMTMTVDGTSTTLNGTIKYSSKYGFRIFGSYGYDVTITESSVTVTKAGSDNRLCGFILW